MLKQLKTLLYVAELGSFHAAAQRAFVSQSAVSMQMKELEEILRMELFDRTVRPPRLTEAGRAILDQAREIVSRCERLKEASSAAAKLRGSIRLGTIPGASFILPDALKDLSITSSGLQVRVTSDLTSPLLDMLSKGQLDAVLVTEPERLGQKLVSRPVITEPLMVLAPRDRRGQTDIQILEGHRYISFDRKAEVSRRTEASLRQRGIKTNPIMESGSLETFQMMIQRGLGVGILPLSSIGSQFKTDLCMVPFGTPALERKIVLVQTREQPAKTFVDALYQALLAAARDYQATEAAAQAGKQRRQAKRTHA